MMQQGPIPVSYGFGSHFTGTGKRLLLLYGVIYFLELICEHWLAIPVTVFLKLYPFGHPDFQIWQILTHPFIHDPSAPIAFLINCLVFYFFSGSVESAIGTRRFLILFYVSALGSVVCGLLLSMVTGLDQPFMGMLPSLLSLVVAFGLLNPEASILLFFVLPVKAKYISYGTILITVLTFLAKANPFGAYHLGGIFFGCMILIGPKQFFSLNRLHFLYLEWQLKKKKSRFRVIHGEKKDNDKPTLH
ncbi:MAG: rhomboid family intramembrane serine protease [Desulfobacteraceae bacterium]|nr:MAG: rhomboid family intramembrane serine protease [Desulfobacteraceae bacterium]